MALVVGRGGVLAVHARNRESTLLTNGVVGVLLTVRRQAAVCVVTAEQALISGDPGAFDNQ